MKQIKLKRYLVGALSCIFAFVLGLAVWTGLGRSVKASAADSYSLKFVDTSYIETLSSVNVNGNGSGSLVTEEAISGKAVKIEVTDTSAYPFFRVFENNTVTAGEVYHIRLKLKGNGVKVHLWQHLAHYELIDDWITTTNEWVEYSYDYTVKNTSSENVMLFFQTVGVPDGGGVYYIEDFSVEKTVTVTSGSAIGALPALDTGKAWTIDEQQITSETVWNYAEDKTAVAVSFNTLTFDPNSIDRIEGMTASDFGAVSNATGEIKDGVLTFTTGSTNTANGASPWVCLSATALSAGEYTLKFSMQNALWVNLRYEVGGHTFSNTNILQANVSPKAVWTEYEFTFTLESAASSLYFLIETHKPSSAGNYVVSLDNFIFAKNEALETKSVISGNAIGELPALSDGYFWTIDGKIITAETIYNYMEDKTAVPVKAHTLTFQYPDMIDSMTSGSFGAVSNATSAITDGVLTFTTGSTNTANGASPWVCLSATALSAGEYTLKFSMQNALWVNLRYEVGGHTFSNTNILQANVSPKAAWTEYEFTINLESVASSLYFLIETHAPGTAGNYVISIDELIFAAKEDFVQYYTSNQAMELPALSGDYYWTIDGEKVTSGDLYTYGGNKTAIAEDEALYTLTFDGVETRNVKYGEAIGALPAIPNQYTNGKWTIDGVEITASTIYNYTEDKTAVIRYDQEYSLRFELPDMIDSLTSSDFGAVYNATGAITDGVLNFTTGSANTAAGGSPWICLSSTTVAAGNYTLRFKMKNALWVNLSYEIGGHTFSGNTALKNNVSIQNGWVEYEFTISLADDASSLYLLLGTHAPGSAGNYTVSVDDLVFATASRPLTRYFFGDESPIGVLPAIPEKAGYVNGRWTIDGEVITENTIFNYGENKVAELMYDSYYTLSFATPDLIDGMTASDFGSEYNATGAITDGVLTFTTGSASTAAGASPWIRLSSTTLSAGNYTLRFKMKNALWVNLSYQVGGHTFSGNVALQNNVSIQSGWVEYEYTINLASPASSLYFLIATHTPGSAGKYAISIDGLKFYPSSTSFADKHFTVGEKLGALPEVPAKDGYRGYWTIDGEEITSNTVWRYTEAKEAVPAYKPTRYTLTFGYPIGMGDDEIITGGWNCGAAGTKESVEEGALYGSALKYTIAQTGANNIGAYIAKNYESALVSGKTYTFSYWMNITESNSLEMSVFVEGYGDNFTEAVSGVTNGWVYRSRTFTATANGNFVVYLRAGHGSGGNGTVYIDEIYLREAIGDPQSVTVNIGEAIGTLPAVPTISGETGAGRWVVDGKIINADTIWTYEGDVMATFTFVPVYTVTFSGTTKTLAVGDTVGALPEVPAKDGYIGYWVVNGARITSATVWTIEMSATATVEYEVDLGVNVTFEWVEGAAVRVATDGKSGIRFETHLDKASYDALEAKYGKASIETGTFILPYAKLDGRSLYAFVTDDANVAGKDYIKVVNNGWKNRETAAKDGYYQWYGSLVNIKEQNYSLNYVGVGYVKVTVDGEEILILAGEASAENSRSIYHVSYKAYADVNNGLDSDGMDVLEDYLNGIATFVSQGSGVVMDTTLADRGYTATYTLTKSGSTENYVVTAPAGKTINSLVVNNVAFRVTPANVIYFSYYNGSVMVLADDESNTMNASISTANDIANSVQATYTDADWTSYKLANKTTSLTHGLKEGNVQVTSLANSAGVSYLENTLDAYVVSNGTRFYGNTGSNSYGGTEAGSARVNTTNLGYYYYETNVRDITFDSSIPLYLSKTYHVYPDKIHQEFTVVANGTTSSSLTDLGFEMKIPVSKVAKYTIDGTEGSNETNVQEYVGFDISGVGVVGIIVAGDEVRVTVENDGTNYIVRQEKAFTNILYKAEQPTKEEVEEKTAEYVALTSENQFNMWNRLYTDETHGFNGLAAANAEEQAPLSKGNISVESMDGGKFIGYDYASGSYKFAINSRGFNDAYYNYPDKHDKASISITGATSDRTIYISVEGDHALEGAAIMDHNEVLLPMPVQVGKNFKTEYEEPIYDPTDSQWGISITPIRVEKHKDRTFTVLHAMKNWGDYELKQISSISYYIAYYHLSTGVTETTCIAPYFSYSNVYGSFENAWILPDFRGGDTMHDGEPQYDSSGTMMGVSNGASNGMGSEPSYYGTDLGVYVGSEINSSGLTLADIDYSYVSEDGAYEYTYRQVEMPQTDEARTYYTVSLSFLKDTTIDNKAFNLLGWSSRNANFSSYEYLDASGSPVTGSCPTAAYTGFFKTVQKIYPLYKGSSYFSVYGWSSWHNPGEANSQNGSFGLVVKDYAITVNGANSDLGLAFKSDYFGNSKENFAGLTLASSTNFKAGDTITLNVILLPYDKAATTAANVRKVYQDSAINPLTLTATTGSVVADTWVGTVSAKSNVAQFTVSGGVDTTDALGDGADTVNYTLKVTNCTKLGKLVVEEYVGGAWVTYELGPVNGYDGYSVEREADGTFTYSFVIAKSEADRTFRVGF